jgi:hypothetical protein
MDNDHDKLRRLYEGYAAGQTTRSRKRCPTTSEMATSFGPSAPGHLKKKVIDHIASCPACREEFMILLERERQEDAPLPSARSGHKDEAPATAEIHRGAGRVPLWRLAGVVIGLGLIVSSLLVVKRQWELASAMRSARPGITLLAPKTGQVLSGPFVFRWNSRLQADSYILEIFDEDMLPFWTSGKIPACAAEIPAEIVPLLVKGKCYYWTVTGFSGRDKMGESAFGRFTVRR